MSSSVFERAAENEIVQLGIPVEGQVVYPKDARLHGGEGISSSLERNDVQVFLEAFAVVPLRERGIGSVRWVQDVVEGLGPLLELTVGLSILLNTAGMACEHFQGYVDMGCEDAIRCPNNIVIMSEDWTSMLGWMNLAFSGVFTAEALLKIGALGWLRYMCERTNQVDFFLVLVSDLDIVLSWVAASLVSVRFFL
jgi:hypothetical protein